MDASALIQASFGCGFYLHKQHIRYGGDLRFHLGKTQFDINFYNKVQKGFLKLAKSNKKSYKIIDSNLDIKINEDLI